MDETENLKIQINQLKEFGIDQVTLNNKMALWQKELLLSHDKLEEIITNLKQELFKMSCKRNLAEGYANKQIEVNIYLTSQVADCKKTILELEDENDELRAHRALLEKLQLNS